MRRFGRSKKLTQDVVAQAEEILCGGAAAGYRKHGSRVPAWAHVNLLAHGSYDDLLRAAARGRQVHPSTWEFAVGGLAQDLVRLDLNGAELHDLQEAALIPLELELLARRQPEPATPAALTMLVHGAVDEHPMGY